MPSVSAIWTYVSFVMATYFDLLAIAPRSMANNVKTKSATYEKPCFHSSRVCDFATLREASSQEPIWSRHNWSVQPDLRESTCAQHGFCSINETGRQSSEYDMQHTTITNSSIPIDVELQLRFQQPEIVCLINCFLMNRNMQICYITNTYKTKSQILFHECGAAKCRLHLPSITNVKDEAHTSLIHWWQNSPTWKIHTVHELSAAQSANPSIETRTFFLLPIAAK